PKYVFALDGKGTALVKSGRYKEAIIVLDKALTINPKNVLGLYDKGTSLVKSGRYEEAIIVLDKALTIIQRMF
ncbi:MAG: tetratricopeptide repeat protein, partial [Candidatus Nitrosopolaris sp.]